MKITPLPDTRIRAGYAATDLSFDGSRISGDAQTLFGPMPQTWDFHGVHMDTFDDADSRNLVFTDEHRRLIAEAKGGSHE